MGESRVEESVRVAGAPGIAGLRFRHWRGARDFPAMYAVGVASVEADGREVGETGAEFAARYQRMKHCELGRDVLLAEVDGVLVAFSRAEWEEYADGLRAYGHYGWVRPEWRRRGLGRAMIRYNEAHLRGIAATQPADGEKVFEAWAGDRQPDLENLLREEGYAPVRYFIDMVRPTLEDIPNLALPAGIEVRPAVPEQYPAIFVAMNEAFRDHFGHVEQDEQDYANWLASPAFQPGLWQVAWAGDEVAGMILNYVSAEENTRYHRLRGYTEDISVRRPWRRRGLARALLARSLRVLRDLGMTEAGLGVDTDNPSGALRLYEGMGYQTDRRNAVWRKGLA